MNIFSSYQTLKDYRQDPIGFIKSCYKNNGHTTHLKIFGKNLFIISHPEDVLHVLKTNHSSYSKGRTTKVLAKFLGNGLITNDNVNTWRKQHRLIRPLMNLKSVLDFAPKIFEVTSNFIDELEGDEVNSFHQMNRLTWRIILKTLFSQETNPEMELWLQDILALMDLVTKKTRSALPLPFWVPTKDHRRLKAIIKKFDDYVYRLIEERRRGEKKNDLIQHLIDAKEEGVSEMTTKEIRDEVMTFMMAGHETITNSLSWLLIEVAKNKDYRGHLERESDEFFQQKDFSKLNEAPWLGACIDEAMRLWPPVWVFMRQALRQDQVGKFSIPAGSNVVLAPFLTHRSEDFWTEPNKFRPERFLDKKNLSQGVYYPFGLGPRACIGASFAGVEARIILATLVSKFDWSIIDPKEQEYIPGITLRPKNNVMMNFRRRNL